MKNRPFLTNSLVESVLRQTAKDLINKNLIPEQFKKTILQPQMMQAAVHNYIREDYREYSCPECHITLRAPRKWITEHHMMHVNKIRDKNNRENEEVRSNFQVY